MLIAPAPCGDSSSDCACCWRGLSRSGIPAPGPEPSPPPDRFIAAVSVPVIPAMSCGALMSYGAGAAPDPAGVTPSYPCGSPVDACAVMGDGTPAGSMD